MKVQNGLKRQNKRKKFWEGRNFPQPSRLALGPPQPLTQCYWFHFPDCESGQNLASTTHPHLASSLNKDLKLHL